ncbi:hypothetical protein Tco_1181049 [Tanacetum coccineum]
MEMQGIRAGTTPEGLYIAQDEPTEFALMAYTSNSSGSDKEDWMILFIGLQQIRLVLVCLKLKKSTSQTSNTNVEMPRVEYVRPSGVIIEDWVSDDDEDIFQSNDLQATDKPSFKRIEFTNARNESVKPKQAEKPRIIT